jgi:adenosine deaminase
MDYRTLPKIDLHLHLDGAVRTRTILELAKEQDIPLPSQTVRGLQKLVTVGPSCRSLRDFLDRFDLFLPVLKSPEAMERIAYELCEDQAKDGVCYFEARFAPLLQEGPHCTLERSVEAVLSGLRRGGRDFGVLWGLILCFLRPARVQSSMATVAAALKYRKQGVVGVDIAGDEAAPAGPHAPAFRIARRHNLGITVHAGEAGPVENIREAVEKLGAQRIGHGSRLMDDPRLMDRCIKKGIAIEVCLTSNLQTRSVPSIERHPFEAMRWAGVRVTLNTDDPAISRITLSKEYALAARAFGLNRSDFAMLLEHSCDASFAAPSVKKKILSKIRTAWGKDYRGST